MALKDCNLLVDKCRRAGFCEGHESNTVPKSHASDLLISIQVSLPMQHDGKIIVDKKELNRFIESYIAQHYIDRAGLLEAIPFLKQEVKGKYNYVYNEAIDEVSTLIATYGKDKK